MATTKRLFVALDMPKEFIKPLQEMQQQLLTNGGVQARAVPVHQLHLTLQFIGAVLPERVSMIADALKQVQSKQFAVRLDGLFALPNEQAPHVIAVDLVASELAQLVDAIRNSLRLVTSLDERPFVAHVTLVRVKKVVDKEKLHSIVQQLKGNGASAVMRKFVLRESVLSHEGAMHSDIMKYQLPD